MNQRGGFATVAVVIAALFGASYVPPKAVESSATNEDRNPAVQATESANANRMPASSLATLVASCEQIKRQLTRFYPAGVPIPTNAGCYSEGAKPQEIKPPTPSPVQFAVAIVPNPVQTHLPLMFDRQIDSIEQAVQDTGFTYDGSWFPWNQSETSDNQPSAGLQEQPGIMVSRRGTTKGSNSPFENGLVIFVVAEQPTGGLKDLQFAHAIDWITALQGNDSELRVIGPTFSGSLASLRRELTVTSSFSKFRNITVFSGATNADDNVKSFQDFLAEAKETQLRNNGYTTQYKFRTFYESDSLMTDRFLCYMQHEGYDLNHFAILSEDETAFGKASGKDIREKPRCQDHAQHTNGKSSNGYEGTPAYLYYPRDIATLRSAYERESIFSAGKSQASAPTTSLRGDFSEPVGSEHDAVRTYGGQLTPQAQEAALFGISNILEEKDIEFIIVRSSNTLDQLFLSEFLRRSYPNGRVVIDGADLMFRSGMHGASLRGVIMLSPYPLLTWTHDVTPPVEGGRNSSYRVFPQDSSEGTYIAARELFKNLKGDAPVVSISDYGAPVEGTPNQIAARDPQRPPTWVTVVGHRQFWPLAVLNEFTDLDNDGKSHYGPFRTSLLETELPFDPLSQRQAEPANSGVLQGSTGLPGEMWGLLLFCVLLAGWFYYVCSCGSIARPPRLRAYFAPVPRLQHTVLIFFGSLLFGYLAVTLGFVAIFGLWVLSIGTTVGLAAVILTIVLFAYFACAKNFELQVISGENTAERMKVLQSIAKWRRMLKWCWFPALALFTLVRHFVFTYHLSEANRFAVFLRSVFLRSGVSPLLPQVLLIVGLLAWFWFNLRGLALFGDDRPTLPKADDLPKSEVPVAKSDEAQESPSRLVKIFLIFSQEGAGNNIEDDARPLGDRYVKSLCYLLPASYAVLWIALGQDSLRTLGDIRFGRYIFCGVVACIGLVLADAQQLLNTWSQLRQLLINLDRLRLRRTLATLRGLYGGSVWKLSGNVLEERYRLLSRQFESLRALECTLINWQTIGPEDEQRKQIALDQVRQCDADRHTFNVWYVDLLNDDIVDPNKESNIAPLTEFQHMLAATAGCVMKQIILPEWHSDPNTMIRVSTSKDLETDFDRQVAELPAHVSAAEEFFLLPYMGFIQNILGRIRTIGLSMVALFISATLAVSCYPFDPLPAIGAVFVILFIVAGIAIVFTYAEMCRDATLSRIANTTPGELGWTFWINTAALGAGPLLGLLTTLFPSMTDFVVSFLQPGAHAIK